MLPSRPVYVIDGPYTNIWSIMEYSLSVANFFIKKSLESGIAVTPMKLVKLVYIAHGWHLGVTGYALLNEEAQAWKYGPVLASVYHEFSHFGGTAVDEYTTDSFLGISKSPSFPKESMNQFLDGIWDSYKQLSGVELSVLTHRQDTPWDEIWNKQGGKDQKGAIIPNGLIQAHYSKLAVDNIKASIKGTLPILPEELNKEYMQIQNKWTMFSEYFGEVTLTEVMQKGRELFAILSGFNPDKVYMELTHEASIYTRAELSDGTTLQIEVFFGLDEGDTCDTVVTLYLKSEKLNSLQCEFANLSIELERILLAETV